MPGDEEVVNQNQGSGRREGEKERDPSIRKDGFQRGMQCWM